MLIRSIGRARAGARWPSLLESTATTMSQDAPYSPSDVVNVDQIEETRSLVDLVSVQNQLSLEYGSPIGKGEVELCEQHGIAFLPWSPFGGISKAGDAPAAHDPVRAAAEAHGVSPQQVVLAWLLALSPVMIPIPGASRPESIADSVRAVGLELSHEELQSIGRIAQAA